MSFNALLRLSEPTNPLEVRILGHRSTPPGVRATPVTCGLADLVKLEGSYEQIDKRLGTLEARLENGFNDLRAEIRLTDTKIEKLEQKIDVRLDKLERKIDSLAQQTDIKFDKLDRKINTRFSLITLLAALSWFCRFSAHSGLSDL